jgi:tagatose 6-phosphate kinase
LETSRTRETFLAVGLNPTLQNTFVVRTLRTGQVNRVLRQRLDVAGKGANTCRVLAQLGESAVHLTYHGGRNGELYRELSIADGIRLNAANSDCDVRFCHTIIDLAGSAATEIVEAGGPVTGALEEAVLARFRESLSSCHTVIISGSRAPGFSSVIYPDMVREAKEAGLRTILDIRGEDLVACLPQAPDVLKINVSEFTDTFLPEVSVPEESDVSGSMEDIGSKMIELREESGLEVVLTNGRQAVHFVEDGRVKSIKPPAITPANPIGSGDAFSAGFASAIHRGLSMMESVGRGIECAQKNVLLEKPGSLL